jgi:diguanylate cyclase (GGDEF)-like protein
MSQNQPDPRRCVLIVDDEPANIHVLAEALQGQYEVRFATDGARALELASTAGVDLILMDVILPGLDGFELLRLLKAGAETRDIPVIFVTAMDESHDEERGLLLGAVDYITKPIRPAIVRARVAAHIQLKTQRDLLERRALVDGLTGIANRRRFDEELERCWRTAQRAASLTLMLIDVDHFKQFNDKYGHGAGDHCLRRVAQALESCFARSGDLAARYGGEEFALILPGDQGASQARRLLHAVRELGIPHAASSAADIVSVSAGAVEVVPQTGDASQHALQQADTLLYEAKRGGRNRCLHLKLANGGRQVVLAEPLSA